MKRRGTREEGLALKYLEKKGYKLLERNYYSDYGEIDLIMLDKEQLVFVEVKARADDSWGAPREYVTKSKQRRIILTAEVYCKEKNIDFYPRFDVIEIYLNEGKIVHLDNAFP